MEILQLVAEPRRRQILQTVWEKEVAAGDIAAGLDITFGAVSQHLRLLRESGLVTVRREGNRRLYTARPEALGPLGEVLRAMWDDRLGRLAETVERDLA